MLAVRALTNSSFEKLELCTQRCAATMRKEMEGDGRRWKEIW